MKQKNQIIAIVIALILGVLLFFFTTFSPNSSSIDNLPEDGTGIDITKQVYITNPQELIVAIGNLDSYERFLEDLFVFGDTAYLPYINNETDLIGFEVFSVSTDVNMVTVSGRYGSSNNTVNASISLLNKDRIYTSITDTESGLVVDEKLPSNDEIEQLIGVLPIEETNYVIEYVESDNFFTINSFNGSIGFSEAETVFKEKLRNKYSNVEIIRYGADSGSNFERDF